MDDGKPLAGSVTILIQEMWAGDRDVSQEIFDLFFQRLAMLGDRILDARERRTVDGEDLASTVLCALFDDVRKGKVPEIKTRNDLWRMLKKRIEQRAKNVYRDQTRQKRGGGRVRGESVFFTTDGDWDVNGIGNVEDKSVEVGNILLQEVLEELGDAKLQSIAKLLLEGYSVSEIADNKLVDGVNSRRSVSCKVRIIRDRLRKGL
jgi:DNA-directed RNA polymerase specialized sigma24 family protein